MPTNLKVSPFKYISITQNSKGVQPENDIFFGLKLFLQMTVRSVRKILKPFEHKTPAS